MDQLNLLKRKNKTQESDELSEHRFLANCLQMGFRLDDLKELEYVDIAKVMVCSIPEDQKYKKASAEDWDKLM